MYIAYLWNLPVTISDAISFSPTSELLKAAARPASVHVVCFRHFISPILNSMRGSLL